MYNLVTAIGVKKTAGSRWGTVDIAQIPVHQLFNLYRKMYITLSNTFLEGNVTIDLEILRLNYASYTTVFSAFLVSLQDTALTPTVVPPVLKPKYAVYRDAFRTGYNVTPVNILTSDSADLPRSEKTSLKLTKTNPITDMEVFYDNCLVTVNGFFHNTDFDGTAAYVIDGAKSMLKSRQNQIGILSFLPIGNIKNIPITAEMVYKQADDSSLRKRTYVKLGQNTTGKTVLLVLGGYLIFPETGAFWQTGDDTFAIDITRMPFLERFFESQKYLDLSELGLPVSSTDISATNVEQLLSDEVLLKYYQLSQTFFVVVDTEAIFTNRIPLRSSGMPGMMIAYTEPNYPLFVGNGRLAEYWSVKEDGQWEVNVQDSYHHNRVFSTVPESRLETITDSDIPEKFAFNSQGYLLEIGKDF